MESPHRTAILRTKPNHVNQLVLYSQYATLLRASRSPRQALSQTQRTSLQLDSQDLGVSAAPLAIPRLLRAVGTKIPAPSCTLQHQINISSGSARPLGFLTLQWRIASGGAVASTLSQFPWSSIQRRKSDGKLRRKTAAYGRR